MTRTVQICNDGHSHYCSFVGEGLKSKKTWKTENGARRWAIVKGYKVLATASEYHLPIYLDPTSETYQSA